MSKSISFLLIAVALALWCCGADSTGVHGDAEHAARQWDSTLRNLGLSSSQFGHNMRDQFMLAPDYANFNHGSFGSTPKSVIQAQRALVEEMEARPDVWFRGGYQAKLIALRQRMSKYINANADDVVFVENASSGVNAILRSRIVNPDDTVLHLSCAYPMVTNTLLYLQERNHIKNIITVPISFPVTQADDIVRPVREAIIAAGASQSGIKLAVFSHIVSTPAVILPIKELAELCKSYNISVLIDGAHALGQIPVDVSVLEGSGVDYYVTNGHKWLFSAKGSAVMWVSKRVQSMLEPTVVSSSGKFDFVGAFEYTGTRDYTAFLSADEALNFREHYGDSNIMTYNHNLAVQAGQYMSMRWGTEVVAPADMTGCMINIRLPTNNLTVATALGGVLLQNYSTEIVVFAIAPVKSASKSSHLQGNSMFSATGALSATTGSEILGDFFPEVTVGFSDSQTATTTTYWTRLSAQVYLEFTDFVALTDLISKVINDLS